MVSFIFLSTQSQDNNKQIVKILLLLPNAFYDGRVAIHES